VLVANFLSDFEFVEPLALYQNSISTLVIGFVAIVVIIMTHNRGVYHEHQAG
jgi:hypothetical protein